MKRLKRLFPETGRPSMLPMLLPAAGGFELWLDLRGGSSFTPPPPGLFDRALTATSSSPLEGLPLPPIQVVESRLIEEGKCVGGCCAIDSPEAQNSAVALVGSVSWLLVEASDAPMITAENLLGAAEGTPTRIAVALEGAAEVGGLAFALERGVDALVCRSELLEAAGAEPLMEALQICKSQRLERQDTVSVASATGGGGEGLQLQQAGISAVSPGGTADRVALDFTRLMADDEGCLVGSSAKVI